MADPTVLLLPGTLCTAAVFARQAVALESRGARVHTVEFRRETSIRQMAETAIRQLPARGMAAVAGFSMGGMVAMELLAAVPERIERVALLNSNGHAELPERRQGRLAALAEARKYGLRETVRSRLLPAYLHRQSPQHCELILAMAEELGLDCFEAQARALATRRDMSGVLKNVACPALIVGAMQDPLCPPQQQREMHRLMAAGTLLMLEDCGHFSTLEQPEALNRALLQWLDEAA